MNINKIPLDMCDCPCHNDGVNLMHCFPCCNYTYQKRSQLLKELENEIRNSSADKENDSNSNL